jgi:hypothetical protein
MLMIAYLTVMLSRWDPVHSKLALSFVVILIGGLLVQPFPVARLRGRARSHCDCDHTVLSCHRQ